MPIYVNGKEIESSIFPGGECHVKIPHEELGDITKVLGVLWESDDIMKLILTISAIRQIKNTTRIFLNLPYFPYGRQDRVCNKGEAYSVQVMKKLVNSLNCEKVEIYHPHSLKTVMGN